MNLPHTVAHTKVFGVLLGFLIPLTFSLGTIQAAENSAGQTESDLDFKERFSLSTNASDLCVWERELGFFLSQERSAERSDRVACADRLAQHPESEPVMTMKDEFKAPEALLVEEIDTLVAGFPIAVMTQAIARYDREIAGLIVGIGKKESNWGKRTPKQNGEECYNFWGYRGMGTKGLTADGYGCWTTPEEAVKTIGDRLTKLREVRASAEPARMIVWKCGSTCSGHSDESVRKWIADVNFYYQEIAKN